MNASCNGSGRIDRGPCFNVTAPHGVKMPRGSQGRGEESLLRARERGTVGSVGEFWGVFGSFREQGEVYLSMELKRVGSRWCDGV